MDPWYSYLGATLRVFKTMAQQSAKIIFYKAANTSFLVGYFHLNGVVEMILVCLSFIDEEEESRLVQSKLAPGNASFHGGLTVHGYPVNTGCTRYLLTNLYTKLYLFGCPAAL